MLRRFLLMCRIDLEQMISTPHTSFFVKNHSSIRLCYIYEGRLKYINLATPLEVAKFLKRNGEIQWYMPSREGNEIIMYRKEIVAELEGDSFVWRKKNVVVSWDDIYLSQAKVQAYAAAYEVGINPVIKMFVRQNFQAA
jgi:hypothetical protein